MALPTTSLRTSQEFSKLQYQLVHTFRTNRGFQRLICKEKNLEPRVLQAVREIDQKIQEHLRENPPSGSIPASALKGRFLVTEEALSYIHKQLGIEPEESDDEDESELASDGTLLGSLAHDDFKEPLIPVLNAKPSTSLLQGPSLCANGYDEGKTFGQTAKIFAERFVHTRLLNADVILQRRLEEIGAPIPEDESPLGGTENLVLYFNKHTEMRGHLRNIILEQLHICLRDAWEYEGEIPIVIKKDEASNARATMLMFFNCNDPLIKENALNALIDILEGDPIVDESAYSLASLQTQLYEYLSIDNMQNLSIPLQRLLVKSYAICLEVILLHTGSTLNALSQELKDLLWTRASTIKDINITRDVEISFWSEFALQAAQRIKTDQPYVKAILIRLSHLASIGILVGKSIATESVDTQTIYTIFTELRKLFYHIEWHKQWFENLFILKRLCHATRYNHEAFRDIIRITQDFKTEQERDPTHSDANIFFGTVCAIENVILHSAVPEILDNGIKVLLQFVGFESTSVKERIVVAFRNFAACDRPLLIATASHVLSLLSISAEPIIKEAIERELVTLPYEGHRYKLKDLTTEERQTCLNMLKFLLRNLGDIKSESDGMSSGLASLLTLSESLDDEDTHAHPRVPALLDGIYEIHPESFSPDGLSRTLIHIAVLRHNIRLLYTLKPERYKLDIQDRDIDGNTALVLAVKESIPDAIYPLARMGINPALADRDGKTFLHHLCENRCGEVESTLIIEQLASGRLSFKLDLAIDHQDTNGKTALHLALENKNIPKTNALIDLGADVFCADLNGLRPIDLICQYAWTEVLDLAIKKRPELLSREYITQSAIISAAQNSSSRSLVHLIRKKTDELHPLEIFAIFYMIHNNFDELNNLKEFLEFHLEKMGADERYNTQIKALAKLEVHFDENKDGSSTQKSFYIRNSKGSIDKNTLALALAGDIDADPELIRSLGVTELMQLSTAPKGRFNTKRFSELIALGQTATLTGFGKNALHFAVMAHQVKAGTMLIDAGIDVMLSELTRGYTPLHIACAFHDVELARPIIARAMSEGIDLCTPNIFGVPPWLCAIGVPRAEQIHTFRLPWKEHILNDDTNNFESIFTLMDQAVRSQHAQGKTATSIENFRDQTGNNVLHYICLHGHEDQIGFVLELYPQLFWEKNHRNRTPLELAITYRRPEMMRALILAMGYHLSSGGEFPNLIGLAHEFARHDSQIELGDLLSRKEDLIDLFLIFCSQNPRFTMNASSPQKGGALMRMPSFSQRAEYEGIASSDMIILPSGEQFTFSIREYTPLHTAARKGIRFLDIVEVYRDHPHMFFAPDPDGNTPLHTACYFGQVKVLELMLDIIAQQPDPLFQMSILSKVNDFHQTPLHVAASQNSPEHFESMKLMLKAGVDPSRRDGAGNNIAHYICRNGSKEQLRLLLDFSYRQLCAEGTNLSVDPKYRDYERHEAVKKLFLSHNDNYRTPSMIAAIHGKLEILQLLSDPYPSSVTPISSRSIHVPSEVQSMISSSMASPLEQQQTIDLCHYRQRDHFGYDHVRLAAQSGQDDVLTYLIDIIGLPFTGRCIEKETALHGAVYNGHVGCVEILLDRDRRSTRPDEIPLFRERDIRGETPAHEIWKRHPSCHRKSTSRAAKSISPSPSTARASGLSSAVVISATEITRRAQIAILLLDAGVNMESKDEQGRTPWHLMCRFNFSHIFAELLASYYTPRRLSLSLNLTDYRERNPAHIAATHGQTAMLRIAADHGCKLNAKDKDGFTPALRAANVGAIGCINLLLDRGVKTTFTARPHKFFHGREPKGQTILALLIDTPKITVETLRTFQKIRNQQLALLKVVFDKGTTIFHILAQRGHETLLDECLPYMENNNTTRQLLNHRNHAGLTPSEICDARGYHKLAHLIRNYPRGKIGSKITRGICGFQVLTK